MLDISTPIACSQHRDGCFHLHLDTSQSSAIGLHTSHITFVNLMPLLNYRKSSVLTGSWNQPFGAGPGTRSSGIGPDSSFWNRYPTSGFSNGSVVSGIVGATMLRLASFRYVGIWPLLEAQSQYLFYISALMTLTSHLHTALEREKTYGNRSLLASVSQASLTAASLISSPMYFCASRIMTFYKQ